MLLPLAERMTEKYVNEDRIEAEAEVGMYIMILELLGKHEKALQVVRGPLSGAKTFHCADPLSLCGNSS